MIALAGIGSYALTSKDKGGDRAARYLRENALDVRQGIAQGEGPVVDDLAAAFRVHDSRRLQFVRGLRAARIELFSLAEPASLTDERALHFLERVRAVAEAAAA